MIKGDKSGCLGGIDYLVKNHFYQHILTIFNINNSDLTIPNVINYHYHPPFFSLIFSYIIQEAILCCILWDRYTPIDNRERIQTKVWNDLLFAFQQRFMFEHDDKDKNKLSKYVLEREPIKLEEETIKPVIYNESSMIRRAIITSLALLRDKRDREEYEI